VPHKFEAGTPDIAGAVGLHAAMDYLDAIGRPAIAEHDGHLARDAYARLASVPGIRLFGPPGERGGLVSFSLAGAHPHDVVTFADQEGIALRGRPSLHPAALAQTRRDRHHPRSFYLYNTAAEVDFLIEVIGRAARFFGG